MILLQHDHNIKMVNNISIINVILCSFCPSLQVISKTLRTSQNIAVSF